jgi:hypothetical protein
MVHLREGPLSNDIDDAVVVDVFLHQI